MLTLDAFTVPTCTWPAAPVAVPTSMETLPEFDAVPVALPDATVTFAEFVDAKVWLDVEMVSVPVPPAVTAKLPTLVSSGVVTDVENVGFATVATLMEPAPFVITTLVPLLSAAATGALPVDPMSSCPFVGAVVAVIAPPAPE
jgi:hypothetical protein